MQHRTSQLHMGWRQRTAEAYGLAFAALASLVNVLPIGLSASSPTVVSAFLSGITTAALPKNWVLITVGSSARLEIDISASLALAFIVVFPVAAYAALRMISKVNKSLIGYLVCIVALFYLGLLFGAHLSGYYVSASLPDFIGLTPFIDALDFYQAVLSTTVIFGLAFTTPVYLIAATKLGQAAPVAQ